MADLVEFFPEAVFLSSVFPAAFQSTLSTLTLLSPQIVLTALDTLRAIISHESLLPPSGPTPSPPTWPTFAENIRGVVATTSVQLVGILIDGLVEGVEDSSSSILTVLRVLSLQFPDALEAGIPPALERLNAKLVSTPEKVEFMGKFDQ